MLEPTWPERARTALAGSRTAEIAVRDADGIPILERVPMIDDGSGAVVVVISNLSPVTLRAWQDARAATLVDGRVMLQGWLRAVPGLQQHDLTERFVDHHPDHRDRIESIDFSWFRVEPDRVRWTDDDGTERWLTPADLANAEPDPLSGLERDLIADVAERLDDDLVLMVRALSGRWRCSDATLVGLDRYGLVVDVVEPGRRGRGRVPFSERIDDVAELHLAIAAASSAARSSPSARA